jgi:hypothetical protein
MQQLTYFGQHRKQIFFHLFIYFEIECIPRSSDLTPSAGIRVWETLLFFFIIVV